MVIIILPQLYKHTRVLATHHKQTKRNLINFRLIEYIEILLLELDGIEIKYLEHLKINKHVLQEFIK